MPDDPENSTSIENSTLVENQVTTNTQSSFKGADVYEYKFKPGYVIAEQYQIVAPIGFGGFAEVYRCRELQFKGETPIEVALKVVIGEYVNDKVLGEASKAALLRGGPHIVNVYQVAKPNEKPFYISMQLLTGGTLEKKLDEAPFRRLPLKALTLTILEQIGMALDYAHSRHIVHLDVKPSNILFSEDKQAFLGDFGLAAIKDIKDAKKVSKMSLSADVHISGTIPYMSPELVAEEEVDYRTDIYALGVVAYEMLTGQLPYRGRLTALLANIAKAEPIPPRMANPELPQRVEEVLLKVLSKDPNNRYRSCNEFVKELQAAAEAYIQIEALYEEAISAIQAQKWPESLEKLKEVQRKAPGHKNAQSYLRDAQDQVILLQTYNKANLLCEKGGFQECIDTLQSLEERLSEYKPEEPSRTEEYKPEEPLKTEEKPKEPSDVEKELRQIDIARQEAVTSLIQNIKELRQRAKNLLVEKNRQEAQNLYEKAKVQFTQGDYERCKKNLIEARELDTDFKDLDNLEGKVTQVLERQQHLQEIYDEAVEFSKNAQWDKALQTFNDLEKEEPNYRDVRQRLVTVEHMAELAELYQQAAKALENREFEIAIQALNRRLDKNRRHEADKVAKLQTQVFNTWYTHARQQLEAEQWDESKKTLNTLQRYNSEYGDPENIENKARLGEVYDQAVSHEEQRHFAEALSLWLRIQKEAPDYKDSQNVALHSKDGLYTKAQLALAQGRYQDVVMLWEQIIEADPTYVDKEGIVAKAKAKLEEQGGFSVFLANIRRGIGTFWQKVMAQWRKGALIGGSILAVVVIIILFSTILKQCSAPPIVSLTPTPYPTTPIAIATPTRSVTPSPTATRSIPTNTPTSKPSPTSTLTSTPSPTSTSSATPTKTTTPKPPTDTPTATPSPTPKMPTATPTPKTPTTTPTSTYTQTPSSDSATALENSGIYAAPSSDSTQLGYVAKGAQVPVLGRSAIGQWFYVRNAQNLEGFAYAPRFQWSGDFNALPIKQPLETVPSPTPTLGGTTNGNLEIDIWPLDGQCVASGGWDRMVYIAGRGGNGIYTYYWNGEKVGGPMREGTGFTVHGGNAAVIGTGRVVSGDGQVIEKVLYIPSIDCGN